MWMYRAGADDWRDWGNAAENWASRLFPPVRIFMELVNQPRAHPLQDTGVLLSRGSGWFHTPCGYTSSLLPAWPGSERGAELCSPFVRDAKQALASLPVFVGLVSSRCCCLAVRAGLGSSMVHVMCRVWCFRPCQAMCCGPVGWDEGCCWISEWALSALC